MRMIASMSAAALVLGAALTVSTGVAFADTGPGTQACNNASVVLSNSQQVLAADTSAATGIAETIPDPNNTGQTITNPAFTAAQNKLSADRQRVTNAQAVVNTDCTASSTPAPTTTPAPVTTTPAPTTTVVPPPPSTTTVVPPVEYQTCAEYNAHGIFDIPRSDPRYRPDLDRNHNGFACERNETPTSLPPVDTGPDNGTNACDEAKIRQQEEFVALNNSISHLDAVDTQVVNQDGGDAAHVTNSDQQLVRDASRAENARQLAWQRARNHRIRVCRDNGGTDITHIVVVSPAPAGTTYVTAPAPAPPVVVTPQQPSVSSGGSSLGSSSGGSSSGGSSSGGGGSSSGGSSSGGGYVDTTPPSSSSGTVTVTPHSAPDTGDGTLAPFGVVD